MGRTLYLMEMGMFDNNITTDIKNHRIRTLENIDIIYKGQLYNMFFEFTQCDHYETRTTHKTTGKPLKHPKRELVKHDAVHIDTQYEVLKETFKDDTPFYLSYRNSDLEMEVWNKHYSYSKADILKIINTYAVEKYDKIVLIETEAKRIINKIGGYRELAILAENADFRTEGDSFMQLGGTWNEEHKIVRVNRRKWKTTEGGKKLVIDDFCEVDLVTGKITA